MRHPCNESRQICWTSVLDFVVTLGVDPCAVLLAGTPAWSRLPDSHPDKIGAVLALGVHYALRLDTEQESMAKASKSVAAAADWKSAGQRLAQGRGSAYIPRKAS